MKELTSTRPNNVLQLERVKADCPEHTILLSLRNSIPSQSLRYSLLQLVRRAFGRTANPFSRKSAVREGTQYICTRIATDLVACQASSNMNGTETTTTARHQQRNSKTMTPTHFICSSICRAYKDNRGSSLLPRRTCTLYLRPRVPPIMPPAASEVAITCTNTWSNSSESGRPQQTAAVTPAPAPREDRDIVFQQGGPKQKGGGSSGYQPPSWDAVLQHALFISMLGRVKDGPWRVKAVAYDAGVLERLGGKHLCFFFSVPGEEVKKLSSCYTRSLAQSQARQSQAKYVFLPRAGGS